MTRTDGGARIVTGAAMIAAPATLLAAAIVHTPHAATDADAWFSGALADRQRFYAAHLLFLIAAVLLIPTVLGIMRILLDRGRGALALVGGLLALAGAVGFGALIGLDLAVWRLAAETDRDRMLDLVRGFNSDAATGVPLVGLTAGLAVGIALLAIGLFQARVVPAWSAVLIAAGPIVLLAALGVRPVVIAAAGGMLVALAPLGRREIVLGMAAEGLPVGSERHGEHATD